MDSTTADAIREQIASGKTSILEWIAKDHSVATLDVLRLLPDDQRTIIVDPPVKAILDDLSTWGDLMIIVQTGSIVAEVVSALPRASEGRGYFNFGGGAPFGGHLKQDACRHVAFIERLFSGRTSLSIVFYDDQGESILKVFVRRDESRELLADQVEKFQKLKARFAD